MVCNQETINWGILNEEKQYGKEDHKDHRNKRKYGRGKDTNWENEKGIQRNTQGQNGHSKINNQNHR